ncbi:hypothetical protein BUE80_DR000318 [Diplocarpon rosae]|nr:hypothetical protein BUE80_DR000318 [Diplocarpon rosae]
MSTLDVLLTAFFLMLFLISRAFHFDTHDVNNKSLHCLICPFLGSGPCTTRYPLQVIIFWALPYTFFINHYISTRYPGLFISPGVQVNKFAQGRFMRKIMILLSSTLPLLAGAIVRLSSYILEDPAEKPRAPQRKVVFYVTGFASEIIVVAIYMVRHIDRRFWVPDGSKGPGDCTCPQREDDEYFRGLEAKSLNSPVGL